jgi:Tol biopolymer transport system component
MRNKLKMEENKEITLNTKQQLKLTLFAIILGVLTLFVVSVCGFANRLPELFQADPTIQNEGEIGIVEMITAVSTSTPANSTTSFELTPTSTLKRPLDPIDNVTPAPTQPSRHPATPTSPPRIDLEQFVTSLTWQSAFIDSDFAVQKLTHTAYGWRGAWYCDGPFQWLTDEHLLLNPIIGYTNWFEDPTEGQVTQPVVIDLNGDTLWQTSSPPTDRCDLPVWSDALQAVITAVDGTVRVYSLTGELLAEYPGDYPLHIAPSGLRLLANKNWIDLELNMVVQLGGAPRVMFPNPAWTADERQFFDCCFSYGSVSNTLFQNQSTFPGIQVTGIGVGPGFKGSTSRWVGNDTRVMIEPSSLNFWTNEFRPVVPLIDPITQTYEDVVQRLRLPDTVINCGVRISPVGDYFWLSCGEQVDEQHRKFYEISYLIHLPSWEITTFPGKIEFQGWSPNGRFFLYNLLNDDTATTGSTWLVSLDRKDNIKVTDYPATAVAFTADSSLVAFGTLNSSTLAVLNISTLNQAEIPLDEPVLQLFWQPVENGLAFLTDDGRLSFLVDPFAPESHQLYHLPAVHVAVHWSPNGKRLAATSGQDLYVVDITSPILPPNNAGQSGGYSNNPIISHDGQVIAFTSTGNLTINADFELSAYVRDMENEVTELVNMRLDSAAGNDPIYNVTMSANGRFIAYFSFDDNLVSDDVETCGEGDFVYNCEDLFVYDRTNKTTKRIILGRNSGLGADHTMALSPDGRFITYGDGGQLMIVDLQTDMAAAAMQTNTGEPPDGFTFAPQFADNGDITFVSTVDNLVSNDQNDLSDIFVRDGITGEITRISVPLNATDSAMGSGTVPFHERIGSALAISGNGRYVAFSSQATTLPPDLVTECEDYQGHLRPCYNLFLHDRTTHETKLITIGADGLSADGDSLQPSLSADGQYLLFTSVARNLLPDLLPSCGVAVIVNCGHLYLYDTQLKTLQLITRAVDGSLANQASWGGKISGNGRFITFVSDATNLVPNDTNNIADIFRYDRETGRFERVSLQNDDV